MHMSAEASIFRTLLRAAVTIPLTAAALAGCGFHLQGHTPLSPAMRAPYLATVDHQSEFAQSLRRAMVMSGALPVDEERHASAVVHILKDQVIRQVLSTSAANHITEYVVTYNVRFSVTIGEQEVLAPQDVSSAQPYSFDESLQLAKQQEEIVLRQGMARDLADVVMRRLAHVQPAT
jgi:outer membrane lipopolysaccharide assembly protein LptE/RlpB